MSHRHRAMAWSGVAGSLVGFAATLLATGLSPAFTWTGSALSDLGAPAAANPWLFNYGLVVAGVVALPFAWVLGRTARHVLERAGAVSLAGSVSALILVGLFPVGTTPHAPAAIAYFLLFTVGMWVHGTGAALAGDVRHGLVSIWLGIAHVFAWLAWAASGLDGIALPELVGSALFLTWIGLTTRWVLSSTGYLSD